MPDAISSDRTDAENHFRGHLDGIDYDGYIKGWVIDLDARDRRVQLEVRENGKRLATGIANLLRDDVYKAGYGDGFSGFAIKLPNDVFDGSPRTLEIYGGTTTELVLLANTDEIPFALERTVASADPAHGRPPPIQEDTGGCGRSRSAALRDRRGRRARVRPSQGSEGGTTEILPNRQRSPKVLNISGDGKLGAPAVGESVVECYGYHSLVGGWFFCGWVPENISDQGSLDITARFESGDLTGESVLAFSERDRGFEFIAFIEGSGRSLGRLSSLSFGWGAERVDVGPGEALQRLREQLLVERLRLVLGRYGSNPQRDMLLSLLGRQAYSGIDTFDSDFYQVFLAVDEVILCEPDGLLLMGWYLAKPGAVRHVRVRSGAYTSRVCFDGCIKVDRQDVIASVGQQHGYDDPACGFIVFVPQFVEYGAQPYLEVETKDRRVGFRTMPRPKLEGMPAMRRVLEGFEVRGTDVPRAFDIVGPALERLNKSRLKSRPSISALEFGVAQANPSYSVIIPLYGRIDYLEYQLAFFSAHAPAHSFEYIFVLDDPRKRKEAERLAASAYERFRIPFRALLLDRNVGFAPANNLGLEFARGTYVCFLNSDVFPKTPDWLERLAARLSADPTLGVVSAMLLYEDGSVQHQGISFTVLPEFGNWLFPQHPGKGLRPTHAFGLRDCISVTGACIVMPRVLAEKLGGWDEGYAIGDFEDTDLCLRVQQMGLRCAVDLDVKLYHLERKSQAASGLNWRMNLTLYNAWVHQQRWGQLIATSPQQTRSAPILKVSNA